MIERLLGWLDIGFWRQLECCILVTYDCWWYWCKNSIKLSSHFAWTNELWKIVPHPFHLPNYGCESDTPGPGPFKMVKMVPPQNGWWTWISIDLILVELTPSVPRSLYANGHVLRTTWGELRKHNETTSFEPWVQILIPKPSFCWGQIFQQKRGSWRKQGPWDPWVCSECLGSQLQATWRICSVQLLWPRVLKICRYFRWENCWVEMMGSQWCSLGKPTPQFYVGGMGEQR